MPHQFNILDPHLTFWLIFLQIIDYTYDMYIFTIDIWDNTIFSFWAFRKRNSSTINFYKFSCTELRKYWKNVKKKPANINNLTLHLNIERYYTMLYQVSQSTYESVYRCFLDNKLVNVGCFRQFMVTLCHLFYFKIKTPTFDFYFIYIHFKYLLNKKYYLVKKKNLQIFLYII